MFIREEVSMSLSVAEKFAYLHPAEAQQRLDSKRTLRPQRLAFGQPVWTEKSKMDGFKGCSIGDTLLNKDCSSLERERMPVAAEDVSAARTIMTSFILLFC